MKAIVVLMLATFSLSTFAANSNDVSKCNQMVNKLFMAKLLCNLEQQAADIASTNYRSEQSPINRVRFYRAMNEMNYCLDTAEELCNKELSSL